MANEAYMCYSLSKTSYQAQMYCYINSCESPGKNCIVDCWETIPYISELIGSFIGLILWGLYVSLFVTTLWMLRMQKMKYTPAILGMGVIFVLNVLQTAVTINRQYEIFIRPTLHPEASPTSFTFITGGYLVILQDLVFILSSFTADIVLVWRLYIIWERDFRVLVIPVAGLLAFLAEGTYMFVLNIIRTERPISATESARYFQCTEAVLIIDVIVNGVATLMIVWKLWRVGMRSASMTMGNANPYKRIIVALVESGSLYTVVMTAYLTIWFLQLPSVTALFSPSLPRIIGIFPLMILIQLTNGRDDASGTHSAMVFSPREAIVRHAAARPPNRDSLSFDDLATHGDRNADPGDEKIELDEHPLSDEHHVDLEASGKAPCKRSMGF